MVANKRDSILYYTISNVPGERNEWSTHKNPHSGADPGGRAYTPTLFSPTDKKGENKRQGGALLCSPCPPPRSKILDLSLV